MQIFSPWNMWNVLDGVLGVLTFWIWDDLGLGYRKRGLRRVEGWLEDWNRNEGAKEGVRIIPLRRTAYLSVSLLLPGRGGGCGSADWTFLAAGYTDSGSTGMRSAFSPASDGRIERMDIQLSPVRFLLRSKEKARDYVSIATRLTSYSGVKDLHLQTAQGVF